MIALAFGVTFPSRRGRPPERLLLLITQAESFLWLVNKELSSWRSGGAGALIRGPWTRQSGPSLTRHANEAWGQTRLNSHTHTNVHLQGKRHLHLRGRSAGPVWAGCVCVGGVLDSALTPRPKTAPSEAGPEPVQSRSGARRRHTAAPETNGWELPTYVALCNCFNCCHCT